MVFDRGQANVTPRCHAESHGARQSHDRLQCPLMRTAREKSGRVWKTGSIEPTGEGDAEEREKVEPTQMAQATKLCRTSPAQSTRRPAEEEVLEKYSYLAGAARRVRWDPPSASRHGGVHTGHTTARHTCRPRCSAQQVQPATSKTWEIWTGTTANAPDQNSDPKAGWWQEEEETHTVKDERYQPRSIPSMIATFSRQTLLWHRTERIEGIVLL